MPPPHVPSCASPLRGATRCSRGRRVEIGCAFPCQNTHGAHASNACAAAQSRLCSGGAHKWLLLEGFGPAGCCALLRGRRVPGAPPGVGACCRCSPAEIRVFPGPPQFIFFCHLSMHRLFPFGGALLCLSKLDKCCSTKLGLLGSRHRLAVPRAGFSTGDEDGGCARDAFGCVHPASSPRALGFRARIPPALVPAVAPGSSGGSVAAPPPSDAGGSASRRSSPPRAAAGRKPLCSALQTQPTLLADPSACPDPHRPKTQPAWPKRGRGRGSPNVTSPAGIGAREGWCGHMGTV